MMQRKDADLLRSTRKSTTVYLQTIYWSVLLILASGVFILFLFISNISSFDRGSIGSMVYGTAHRPYVYRTLLPSIVRFLVPLVPIDLANKAANYPLLAPLLLRLDPVNYPRESLLMLMGMYLCFLGFIFALRFLMRSVGYSLWTTNWISVICLLLLPPFFPDGKVYDWPNIFLFTLGLALLVRRNWIGYTIVFTMAVINKETAIILALVFIVHFYRVLERRQFIFLLSIQGIIYVVVRIWLLWIFKDNPGAVVEIHLSEQLLAFRVAPFSLLVPLIILMVLIRHRWKEKPAFIRHTLIILVPLGITQLLFGGPYEIRVYLEALPIVLLLVSSGLFKSSILYSNPCVAITHGLPYCTAGTKTID